MSATGTCATATGCSRSSRSFCSATFPGVADHDDEVEEALWIPLDEAPARLAYKGEREMAEAALSTAGEGQ